MVCHMHTESFTCSFLNWIPFISFSYVISVISTSNTMLTRDVESRHACLVHDLRGKTFNFAPSFS